MVGAIGCRVGGLLVGADACSSLMATRVPLHRPASASPPDAWNSGPPSAVPTRPGHITWGYRVEPCPAAGTALAPLISLERDVRGSYEQRHPCQYVDRYRGPPCSGSSHSGNGTSTDAKQRQTAAIHWPDGDLMSARRSSRHAQARPPTSCATSWPRCRPHCWLTCWLLTGISGRIRGSDERARSGRGGRNCERPFGVGEHVIIERLDLAEGQRASVGRAPSGPDQRRHPVHRPR